MLRPPIVQINGFPPVTAMVVPDVKLESGSASMTYVVASSAGLTGAF